jgi:TolA-binding protein
LQRNGVNEDMSQVLATLFQNLGIFFEDKIKDLEGRIARLEQANNISNSKASETKKAEYIYFASVTADGTFSTPSSEQKEYSIYCFEKNDEKKARVYVIENNPSVAKRFANNTDTHESACKPLNPCPKNPTGIKTTKPGEAVLVDNDKWSIKTKVEIEYLG